MWYNSCEAKGLRVALSLTLSGIWECSNVVTENVKPQKHFGLPDDGQVIQIQISAYGLNFFSFLYVLYQYLSVIMQWIYIYLKPWKLFSLEKTDSGEIVTDIVELIVTILSVWVILWDCIGK